MPAGTVIAALAVIALIALTALFLLGGDSQGAARASVSVPAAESD